MYSLNINTQQYNNYNTVKSVKATGVNKNEHAAETKPSFTSNPIMAQVPYNAALTASRFRTELSSKDEKNKYNELLKISDRDTKKQLNTLLKTGILLNADSNDNSTTLDNLYKIATTQRAQGLSNNVILKDTIETLADPHIITQQFGNIPDKYRANVEAAAGDKAAEINVEHSGTCVASSIEFNLADKHPAEFARFAEGLSSQEMSVKKTIKMNNLADNTLDAIWLLNAFEIPYEAHDFDRATLKFAPDKNAIVRAFIQTVDKDRLERSPLDVLMQSTFMQVGSQQSYDSLTDKRAGKFNQNDKGLIEFEKTFTESVVEDKNKISVTYQTVDENAKLIGYETSFDTMKKQITDALNLGENVIVGYTQVDNTNTIINGHEITIIGTKTDKDGKMIFICNDTDDNVSKPIEYSEDYLLPKIHHAALPQSVVANDVNLVENWVEGLKTYKELKKQSQMKQAA
ncbi:unknown [Fusobacterium sp. CAG:439]|nr:unknown [Fusobacterium sp. CAG:439]